MALGIFHSLLTEPVLDQAITIEEQQAHHQEFAEPLVSREVQKAMLVVGSALYGLLWGGMVAVGLSSLGRYLPGREPGARAALLAGLLWWAVVFLPFLKYPANPPGGVSLETMDQRQNSFLLFILLSLLAMLVAWGLYGWLGRRQGLRASRGQRLALALGLYGVLALLLLSLMPPSTTTLLVPDALLWRYRALSLAGTAVFWAILGGASALLLQRFAPAS